jgi:hypothetical protein
MLTIEDVKDRLKHLDEVTLLEVLDISAADLVDRFPELVEDNYEHLADELADEDYDDVD